MSWEEGNSVTFNILPQVVERCLVLFRKLPLPSQTNACKKHFARTPYIPLPAVWQQNTKKTFISFVRSLPRCLQLEIPREIVISLYLTAATKEQLLKNSCHNAACFLPSTVVTFPSSQSAYAERRRASMRQHVALQWTFVPWKACLRAVSSLRRQGQCGGRHWSVDTWESAHGVARGVILPWDRCCRRYLVRSYLVGNGGRHVFLQ